MSRFYNRVSEIVEDYLNAFHVPNAEISELDTAERQDLLNMLMEELAIAISQEELDDLIEKRELRLEDIVDSLESGESIDFEI